MVEHAPPGRTNAVPIAEELEDANFDVAPPAYSDHHDRLRFTQAGFAADAAVTGGQNGTPCVIFPQQY